MVRAAGYPIERLYSVVVTCGFYLVFTISIGFDELVCCCFI